MPLQWNPTSEKLRTQGALRLQREHNAGLAYTPAAVSKIYSVSACMCLDQASCPRTSFKPVEINPVGQVRVSWRDHSRAHHNTALSRQPGTYSKAYKQISCQLARTDVPHHTQSSNLCRTGWILGVSDTILWFSPWKPSLLEHCPLIVCQNQTEAFFLK